jgi:hypothetical protein
MSGKKIGAVFLQIHLGPDVSTRELIFSAWFGIIGPIFCFLFDPIVFQRTSLVRPTALGGVLAEYYLFAYLGAGIGILTLILQLLWAKRLRMGGGVVAGVLLSGALVALLIGLLILPYSAFGIIVFGIGLLGFIPFLTSLVFFRNGLRALRQAKNRIPKSSLILSITLGIIIAIGIPGIVNWGSSRFVEQSIETIHHGDAQQTEASIQRLKHAFWCNVSCFDDMVEYYQYRIFANDSERARFADAYMEITGDDIKDRRRELYPWYR